MEKRVLVFGLILLLAVNGCAEYLEPKCQSILNNDLVNLIRVEDVDRNGVPNILVGTSVNGILYNYVYKGADCTIEWTALASGGWSFNTKGDVKGWVISDLDGNGRNEVLINSAKSSHPGSAPPTEYLRVIQENSLEEWKFNRECGLTHSVYVTDLDGNGRGEIIMGTQNNKVCAIRYKPADNKYLVWKYETKYPVYYVKSLDIDGDGGVETIALADKYLDAYVYAISKDGTLKWESNIKGGVYTAMLPSNIIDVADLDADGKTEVVVGSYQHGVDVISSGGGLEWSYNTQNIVSSILVSDLDGDGKKEVLVGSAPNVYTLDSSGGVKGMWTAPVDSTIYSISAGDIDDNGRKEVAIGTTKYIYVLDDNLQLIGSWKYTVEIQGLTKAYEERDANAVAVYIGDLDGDGDSEVAAGWNWEESTIRGNEYSTDIRVYEINKDYRPETQTTIISPPELPEGVTTLPAPPTTQQRPSATTQEEKKEGGGLGCLPMLPAILALALTIAAKIPLAATKQ
jgi:hypothetical protein